MPFKDPEKKKALNKQYYAAHAETIKSKRRAWQVAHPESVKQYNIRSAYRLLAAQKKVCEICGARPDSRVLNADYCPKSDKVRGVLCTYCLAGLGLFQDSSELLDKASAYLKGFQS